LIGLDTNVLARYLVEDDPEQSRRATLLVDRALAEGERLFVTQIVLCELVWVLDSAYGYPRQEIVSVLRDLLRTRQLVIEDLDSTRKALERYAAKGGDFADFLIVERCRRAGCARVASFDGGLGKAEEDVFEP
jgi:predicted nucleic-acid-binding protein